MSANILIVEDERIVSMEIESYLSSLGYNIVAISSTADEAFENAMQHEIDLILMDIYLINSNGIDAAMRIKDKKDIPIIFLTAYIDEETIDRAIAVDPVAYLQKPFNRKELFAAIKIGLRQLNFSEHTFIGDIILDNEFSFDTNASQLICCSEIVHLSKKERSLLELFLNHKNTLIPFMTIEYEIWPDKPSNSGRRRTLISRLRTKLKHRFIETYTSEGYIFKLL